MAVLFLYLRSVGMKFKKRNTRKIYKVPAIIYTGAIGIRAGQPAPPKNLNDVFGN